MNVLRTQSIRRQVALGTGLLLLPIMLVAIWSATRTRAEGAMAVRDEAASVASTAAAYLDEHLRVLDSVATALVQHPSVIAMQREQCDRLFASVLRDQPLLLNVILTAADGTIVGSGVPATGERSLATMPHVREVVMTGRPGVSDLTVDPVTHHAAVLFGYPVPPRSGDAGAVVLTLGLNVTALGALFKATPLPDGSVLTLTDRLGLVFARSRDADRYIGMTAPVPHTAQAGTSWPSSWIAADIDGIQRVAASAPVGRGPWILSVGIPTTVIAARVWPIWRRNLAMVALSTLLSLVMLLWVGRHLSQELDGLRAAAQRIAGGDLSPVPPGGSLNREVGQLQTAFGAMAENLRQARTALDHQVEQERKTRRALEVLQRQLVRQERLAAVGLLVSGVAHELNNPLQAIMGASELLERRRDLSDEALNEIALVKTEGHRASEIIRSLSRFSMQHGAPPEVFDVCDAVAEVVQIQRTALEAADIACEVDTTSSGNVQANFAEIAQVVLNFVINAQHAIQSTGVPGGCIVIRSRDVAGRVRVEVRDTGPGVPPGHEPKLFQPFFTTKPVGDGPGLGLSVSYGIIDSYGGTIGYQRSEPRGAVFYFELPCV